MNDITSQLANRIIRTDSLSDIVHPVSSGKTIDDWKREADMDWIIEPRTLTYNYKGSKLTVPNRHTLIREDTGESLSIVSDKYKVVQPGEALEFFRELTEEMGFEIEYAGTMDGGRKYWALAKTPHEGVVGKADELRGYVLFASSCDGKMSNIACFTSLRVWCLNMMTMVQRDIKGNNKPFARITHTATFDPAALRQKLGLMDDVWGQYIEDANKLADFKVDQQFAREFMVDLLYPKVEEEKRMELVNEPDLYRRANSQYAQLEHVYHSGVGQEGETTKGTAWGLLNAVTRYFDHESPAKGNDTRLQNAWFGTGRNTKTRAYQLLMDRMVEAE